MPTAHTSVFVPSPQPVRGKYVARKGTVSIGMLAVGPADN